MEVLLWAALWLLQPGLSRPAGLRAGCSRSCSTSYGRGSARLRSGQKSEARPEPLGLRGLPGNDCYQCLVTLPCSVGQRLPLLGFWELTCFQSSKVTWWKVLCSSQDRAMCDLILTLCFPSFTLFSPAMSTCFSLPSCFVSLFLPCLVSQSLYSLVVVSVQPRWRAAMLSLTVASQNLSYLKWKAEHRLRGTVSMSACQQDLWTPALSLLGHPQAPHSVTASLHGQQSLSPTGESVGVSVPAWSAGMWM